MDSVRYTEEAEKTHSEDVKRMNAAILAVHAEWALLEDVLAWVLTKTLQPGFGSEVGLIIYYTPVSAETRQEIVNRIVLHRLSFHSYHPDVGLGDAWHFLIKKVASARGFRNYVAHNRVVEFTRGDRKQVRLTHSMFDRTRDEPGKSVGVARGHTWKMVRAGAKQIASTRILVGKFHKLLDDLETAKVWPAELDSYKDVMKDLGAEARLRERGQKKQSLPSDTAE